MINNNELNRNPQKTMLQRLNQDALLILCCKQLPTETVAFEELVARIQPQIYRHAVRYLRQRDDAWEVTQEVLLRLYRNLHRFEGRSHFSTWLYRIVENQCHSFVAARSRRILSDHMAVLIQIHEESHRRHEDEQIGDSECVSEAMTHLPRASQEVLTLRFVADQSLEEISQTLDIGLSATKMRLYRALESLKAAYLTVQMAEAQPGGQRLFG